MPTVDNVARVIKMLRDSVEVVCQLDGRSYAYALQPRETDSSSLRERVFGTGPALSRRATHDSGVLVSPPLPALSLSPSLSLSRGAQSVSPPRSAWRSSLSGSGGSGGATSMESIATIASLTKHSPSCPLNGIEEEEDADCEHNSHSSDCDSDDDDDDEEDGLETDPLRKQHVKKLKLASRHSLCGVLATRPVAEDLAAMAVTSSSVGVVGADPGQPTRACDDSVLCDLRARERETDCSLQQTWTRLRDRMVRDVSCVVRLNTMLAETRKQTKVLNSK
jgi:hypothetical protein